MVAEIRAEVDTLQSQMKDEREAIGKQFADQLELMEQDTLQRSMLSKQQLLLLEEELSRSKTRANAKETEISSLHSDFEERIEYVDVLAKQELVRHQTMAAENIKRLEAELLASNEQLHNLEIDYKRQRQELKNTADAESNAIAREHAALEKLRCAEASALDLSEEKKRSSASMHHSRKPTSRAYFRYHDRATNTQIQCGVSHM